MFQIDLKLKKCVIKPLIDVSLHLISEEPFLIVYYADRYKTQRICNEAVDNSLAALKFIPDRFDLVYRYSYSSCNATYYGKTYRRFFARAAEHMGISN